ncbi:MAG TPA: glycosyltransferase 87 family protein, partial [Candidatus Binatia bacterium]|nr:glycosyltransferase 87 family protein [Candidatus Binatia bacterium]
GWRAFFFGVLAPVTMSIAIGQVDLLMAAVIVVGFRYPAAWLLPIITKVTPGIGLIWYVARGEWRNVGTALGATAVVVGFSYLIDPAAWAGWLGMLLRFEFPTSANGVYLPVPVWVRLPVVALLIAWGARTDRRWVLPIGITLSLPTVWVNTPTIMIAMLPLLAVGATTPAGRWLRGEGFLASMGLPAVSLQGLRRRTRRARLVLRRSLAR